MECGTVFWMTLHLLYH